MLVVQLVLALISPNALVVVMFQGRFTIFNGAQLNVALFALQVHLYQIQNHFTVRRVV
jgi:hypothetical protein